MKQKLREKMANKKKINEKTQNKIFLNIQRNMKIILFQNKRTWLFNIFRIKKNDNKKY